MPEGPDVKAENMFSPDSGDATDVYTIVNEDGDMLGNARALEEDRDTIALMDILQSLGVESGAATLSPRLLRGTHWDSINLKKPLRARRASLQQLAVRSQRVWSSAAVERSLQQAVAVDEM